MKFFPQASYFKTSLFLFACLSNIIVNTKTISARTNKCQQIRQVRLLAIEENLDGYNLATLEKYYCDNYGNNNNRFDTVNNSEDCGSITNVRQLATLAQSDRSFLKNIFTLERFVCNMAPGNLPSYYPNGKKIKFGQSWYYPNGYKAKFGEFWYYPNGKKAKFGSSWYYPNGNKAKFGSSWYYPNGQIMKR